MNKFMSIIALASGLLMSAVVFAGSAPPPNQTQPSSSSVTSESYLQAFASSGNFRVLEFGDNTARLEITLTRNGQLETFIANASLSGNVVTVEFPDGSSTEFPAG